MKTASLEDNIHLLNPIRSLAKKVGYETDSFPRLGEESFAIGKKEWKTAKLGSLEIIIPLSKKYELGTLFHPEEGDWALEVNGEEYLIEMKDFANFLSRKYQKPVSVELINYKKVSTQNSENWV